MLTRVSDNALRRLVSEANVRGFTSFTLNRLKNENPGYAHLANFFARKTRAELGERGLRLSLDLFAIAYRSLELSERYPDPKRPILSLEHDPITTASPEARASAKTIADEVIARCRKGHGA
ncbi:MAG: hypothetical protein A3C93_01705 [Candidatus Lloydbacteria bacterium RIFCSPHIGHO2_02_FULL_54_17]|uniref:Uncharacterized protein n=1 Tax=Candidatus Lloydbacteria bacterium RIFCSPHIGHO2_02_FULL_54_17 TaxID=1798664 RepID=A0A1G2DD23_9BACT|nr:MAG: hypothetical protein A2762_03250 [Candidatus Lloydbacteria bacterium RIFCSPHIGHO2_01_FULL_54_11]OGZ11413.1 MAG: hypothetical protein A3C93_01705 [Candidatus Lloydbacteria bacterium RIFCSPHIGHO2_02_FULL_54_17]OGZ13707.1 MAG: hypothetical protein A2948_01965 [Candidatus Lloydbacteria bacterium RIFCSPLOWO2_01_FULL_54_18]